MVNKTLKVLVADDDPNDFLLLEVALGRAGLNCDLRLVRDGQEAIDYLAALPPYADRQCCPWPHLLILDLKMPRVGGLEVLRWIRQQENLPPVYTAVITGSTSPSDVTHCYALGADACLSKPCDLKRFALMLQDLAKHCVQQHRGRHRDARYAWPENLFAVGSKETRLPGLPPDPETWV
jgi:two-component system response regulator